MKFKDARRTSFAIGDKVKILPSAVPGGVLERDVGKVGTITGYNEECKYFTVKMNEPGTGSRTYFWAVYSYQIKPVIRIGQQLLFEFME